MEAVVATRRPRPAPITVTEDAARRIAEIIAKAPVPAAGVRLTTPKRGCSGLAYSLDYVQAAKPGDEAVATPGGTLFIDGGSLMYLIGSRMDWKEDDFAAGFVFDHQPPAAAAKASPSEGRRRAFRQRRLSKSRKSRRMQFCVFSVPDLRGGVRARVRCK